MLKSCVDVPPDEWECGAGCGGEDGDHTDRPRTSCGLRVGRERLVDRVEPYREEDPQDFHAGPATMDSRRVWTAHTHHTHHTHAHTAIPSSEKEGLGRFPSRKDYLL